MTDLTALVPPEVDPAQAQGLAKQYQGALSQTQKQLANVTAQRQDVTTRNLAAIDEAIQGLKNSRQSGPIAFDPAVSAAMAAGFLKTTPGVAGNFMSELGNAMGNAAPVIGNLEKSNRDSFQILADLQRKRGEFEAEPLKEREAQLQKSADSTTKMIEQMQTAGLRISKPTVNPNNGDVIYPNVFGPGTFGIVRRSDPDNIVEVGGTRTLPVGSASGKPPAPPSSADPADKIKYLKETAAIPDVDAPDLAYKPNIDKLHELALKDPVHAREVWEVLNYKVDPYMITPGRTKDKEDIKKLLDDAKLVDPTFDASNYHMVQTNKGKWTGGDMSNATAQAQTAIGHVGELMHLAAALENKDNQTANALKQRIATWSGGSVPTSFALLSKIAADELAKITSGGQSALGDREEYSKHFANQAQSPQQLQDNIRGALTALHARLEAMAIKKTHALGDRRKYTPESLLEGQAEIYNKAKTVDITSSKGRQQWGVAPKPPSQVAIDRLKANPSERAIFDEEFGDGAAAKVLGE